ncbi:hypothetical protein MYCTH_2306853 [Thermothelomyces thermophilus ATCC 42464]|uniref:GDS1 winged helix domain-containing protein n=1 Tax=Thermothelomyces thermophilus (strain ATCC 42464 / BCRC 31852 / DSM 1799) TaxID=573729 RepID=G2QEX2_THET4|nr:uncharacterized protein MYCTH_2306853 [Thermothelomyces thermophilus ATCC 42464]AEO59001.1 hypothetical protein MYCTH_2306853 [Thermothelomyces thermophilus ATCC 42464]
MRPYNTRHKTLSLHSLGIHVPGSNASRAPTNRPSSNGASPVSMASPASPSKESQPPPKRLKRAYSESSDDAPSLEHMRKKRDDAANLENTPPPSPPAERPSIETDGDENAATKQIDMEGINDEIVEAVIVQLQDSGNRPHLVKELAAVLIQRLKIVQQSANPCAIISSRLASYLKRPGWSALSPCPLGKELESAHPRRTYFYLTTCPRQPLPEPAQSSALSQLAHNRSIVSPSPSSAPSVSADESDTERRRELSPSPEVDLSSPEFDDMDDDFAMPSTPIGSYPMHGFYMPPRPIHSGSGRHGRAGSPPLEKDEKEFTQTADGLQKRKLNGDLAPSSNAPPVEQQTASLLDLERDESSLFAVMSGLPPSFVSSPAIRPSTMSLGLGRKDSDVDGWAKLDGMLEWDRSPENIELEELDGLLDDY